METKFVRTTITLPAPLYRAVRKHVSRGSFSKFVADASRARLEMERSWQFSKGFKQFVFQKGEPFYNPKKFFRSLTDLEDEAMAKMERLRKM